MASGSYRQTLRIPGLQSFLWTQFLGAFNDNVYKIIVSFVAIRALGPATGMPLAAAVFILPFFLFSGWSGHLADAFSKRRVLVATKVLEIVAMGLAIPALVSSRLDLQLAVLFLMGAQSTFFSPAKYGIVPELVPDAEISRANGLLEMSTFGAIILGTALGGEVYEAWQDTPWRMGMVLLAIAVIGTLTSLGIPHVRAYAPGQRFALNPLAEISRGMRRLWPDRILLITTIGISYFWFLGALLQQVIIPWGQEAFVVGEAAATRLYTFLAIGIGVGSLAAGRISGDRIELGLVGIGGIGLGVLSLLLVLTGPHYALAAAVLVWLGFFGGLFAVPLNALLQQRPAEFERGRIMATNNVLNTVGMLLSAAVFWMLGALLELTLAQIIVAAALFTLGSTFFVLMTVPEFSIRMLLWVLTHTGWRIKTVGHPGIPIHGAALIVANHVSVMDVFVIAASLQRLPRFTADAHHFQRRGLGTMLRQIGALPVIRGDQQGAIDATRRLTAELADGQVVCIFADGAIGPAQPALPFADTLAAVTQGRDTPIVPVYIDRLWSRAGEGGALLRRPREQATLAWGPHMPATTPPAAVRRKLAELSGLALGNRRPQSDRLHLEFIRVARRQWGAFAIADTTGVSLTYGRALIGSFALARVITRKAPAEGVVGTLLPASVGGALANIALFLSGKIPVNLNFTVGAEALDAAIEQAGIRTILSSRRFLEKAGLPTLPSMVFLEDLRGDIRAADKLLALVLARLAPGWLLRGPRSADISGASTSPLATIIFSSGSTGAPKGIMLTHANVLSNIDSVAQIFDIGPDDRFIGVLPFFHSFGFTDTLWFPLLQGAGVAYHPNPGDAKTIGDLAETHKATMLISTPTFCQTYLRRCTPEQFASLRFAIVGAEKLREPLASEFRGTFGIGLTEGYGCTEMSPVVAANRPQEAGPSSLAGGVAREGPDPRIGTKAGSVGPPIPGVAARIVDVETGAELPTGSEGLLLVHGPGMMTGYLHAPERTAQAIRDGWYVTGDIARLDEDGFIFITDRLTRFSKIAGEMVPHLKIEEAMNAVIGGCASVVTSVPDAAKGERIVAFYVHPSLTPESLWEQLARTEMPRLWIPRRDCLVPIDAIPTLGTGKIDLRHIRQLALERVAARAAGAPLTADHYPS